MFKFARKEYGRGEVYAIDKDKIWVITAADSGAASKKSCKVGCGSCSTQKTERRFSVPAASPEKFNAGQQIHFRRFIPEPNLVSFLVFGIPILLALTSMLCWLALAPQKAESPLALLCTAAAFFCGFFILMVIDALFKKRYPASITNGNCRGAAESCGSLFTETDLEEMRDES